MIKTSGVYVQARKLYSLFCLSTFSQRGDLTRKTFSVSPEYKFKYCLCFLKKVIWQHGFVALPGCWFQTRQRLVC